MKSGQGAALDRKKLMADPVMVTTIVVLITFLTIFILYPLAILLVDSVYSAETGMTMSFFDKIFDIDFYIHFFYPFLNNFFQQFHIEHKLVQKEE